MSHHTLGMATEYDEIIKCLSRDDVDYVNLSEEIGDFLWYHRAYTIQRNIDVFAYQFREAGSMSSYVDTSLLKVLLTKILEFQDCVKKYIAYNRGFDEDIKLYQMFSIINDICHKYSINPKESMYRVVEKLKVRYPEKFDESNAQQENRDLKAERDKLEGNE